MEVIAKTNNGVMISATEDEVMSILSAVANNVDVVRIGQKIPAIDYATTIRKIKALNNNPSFNSLCTRIDDFNDCFVELKNDVMNAASID